jgi:translocon-associated protein subunit beta
MAMAPRSLALLCALLLAAFSTSFAASDAPFLVAHKKVALTRPKPGLERLAVSLDLYNQGSATAYDVTINDDSWPKEAFELVSGEVSKTLERLDP